MIEDVDEFGDVDSLFFRAAAHGQLVAKIAHGGESHAGDAQVFAQGGGVFHVKFIKGDDAVDRLPAREVADGIDRWPTWGDLRACRKIRRRIRAANRLRAISRR